MADPVAESRALVTGASSGIGAALAVALAREGATVGICARRTDRLAPVLDECRAHAPESRMWVFDVGDLDAIPGFARTVEHELGGVDLLVNNAGIPKRRRIPELSEADLEEVFVPGPTRTEYSLARDGNDPPFGPPAGMEADDVAAAILAHIRSGVFEAFACEDYEEIAAAKRRDPNGFLAGMEAALDPSKAEQS